MCVSPKQQMSHLVRGDVNVEAEVMDICWHPALPTRCDPPVSGQKDFILRYFDDVSRLLYNFWTGSPSRGVH